MNLIPTMFLALLLAGNPQQPSRPSLESIARELFTNFNAARFDLAAKNFDDSLRATATGTQLIALKQQTDAALGAFRSIDEVHQQRSGGDRVVELVCRYEKGPASFRVVFDPLDRVSSVFFEPIVEPPIDPALEAAARDVLKSFVTSDFEALFKRLDSSMRAQLPPPKIAQLQSALTSKYGAFQSIKEVHQTAVEGHKTIELIAPYEHALLSIRVVFDDASRVAGIKFAPVAR